MLFLWYYSTYLNMQLFQRLNDPYDPEGALSRLSFELCLPLRNLSNPVYQYICTHTHTHTHTYIYIIDTIVTCNLANRVLCVHRALHPEVMMNVLLAFGKFIFGRYLRAPSMTSSCVAMQQGSQSQHSQALSGEKDGENQWWEKSFTIGHAKTEWKLNSCEDRTGRRMAPVVSIPSHCEKWWMGILTAEVVQVEGWLLADGRSMLSQVLEICGCRVCVWYIHVYIYIYIYFYIYTNTSAQSHTHTAYMHDHAYTYMIIIYIYI